MKKGADFLYLFMHVSKCGGTTFICHLEKNFSGGERRHAHCPHFDAFMGKSEPYDACRKKIHAHLGSLGEPEREKIKIIYGHDVDPAFRFYFRKPARQITFLRNPAERLSSHYNYHRYLFENDLLNPAMKQMVSASEARFPSLDSYLELAPDNYMVRSVVERYLGMPVHGGRVDKTHLAEAKKTLDTFYFVGITENHDRDALYLYHELGIRRFYPRQNVSRKNLKDQCCILPPNDRRRRAIGSRESLDAELYEHAVKLNAAFRQKANSFSSVVWRMRVKRAVLLPATALRGYAGKALRACGWKRPAAGNGPAEPYWRRKTLSSGAFTTHYARWRMRNGRWKFDEILCARLCELFRGASVIEFGGGVGLYAEFLRARGIQCECYDGIPDIEKITDGKVLHLDLSRRAELDRKADWVLALEVGEHIPGRFEEAFIGNIDRHNTRGCVVSWAVPGPGGVGHVNCRSRAYIKELFSRLGYENDVGTEEALRRAATVPWFKNSLHIFRRK